MSSLTIHAIAPDLNNRLDQAARQAGTSKNQLVKNLLARGLGLPVDHRYADDYQEFCGLWSVAEKAEFDASQAGNNQADPGDWPR